VSSFNHEIVPDYLRTKPEMDVESKQKTVADKAANISADAATKQITALNKICNSMILLVQNKKDEWKNEEGWIILQLNYLLLPRSGAVIRPSMRKCDGA